MKYQIRDITKDKIAIIQPVWELLNGMHRQESIHFKDFYGTFTFEQRTGDFIVKNDDDLKISIVYVGTEVKGYCLSAIEKGTGEVESLCLMDEVQGSGLGTELVKQHIDWMKARSCRRIRVSVSCGHEAVCAFYNKLGFKERLLVLEYKD